MRRIKFFLLFVFTLALLGNLNGNTPPTVTNVSASQRTDGSKIVDIWYSVSDADNDTLTVSLAVSNNNGASFSITPSPAYLSGAIGENILSGNNKQIVWNAGAEGFSFSGYQFRVKVTATEKINLSYGLVAYYPFNGNANDESGYGHDCMSFGTNYVEDRFGIENKACNFDGIDDYLDVGDWQFGGSFTISAWVFFRSFPFAARIIDFANGPEAQNIIIANGGNEPSLWFRVQQAEYTGPNCTVIDCPNYFTIGQWDFVTCSLSSTGNMRIYKNGVLINEINNAYIPEMLDRNSSFIGKSNYSWDGYYNGVMDDIRIYNRALTPSEIQALYHEGGWAGNP